MSQIDARIGRNSHSRYEFETSLRGTFVIRSFFFSTARIPFFLTPLCHSSFTAEILYPLFLRYSLFIIRISFPMSEHSFFFSFQISFSTALFHFIPWISVFLTLCSILHEVSFFFRIFRFPSLRIRVSLLSSLNFLLPNEKVKKKSIDDIFTNIIPKFIINEVDPRREAYLKRLLIDYRYSG